MKTKQEVIHEAWGHLWDKYKSRIDTNGFLHYQSEKIMKQVKEELGDLEIHHHYVFARRPKSLAGIETNNGWIRIESEADLPKEDHISCWVIVDGITQSGGFRRYTKETFYFFNASGEGYLTNRVTHYQPIIKPIPPIY